MNVRVLLGVCCSLLLSAFSSAAEPPKIEDLVARMPALSPKTEEVKSCEFEFFMPDAGPFSYRARIAWDFTQGDDACGAVYSDAFGDVPICVVAEGKFFVYDIVGQRGIISDKQRPWMRAYLKDDGNATFGYGIAAKDASEPKEEEQICFDPATYLKDLQMPQWTEKGENLWEYQARSPSGKSEMMVVFDAAKEYPLVSMIMRSREKHELIFEAKVNSVNGPVNADLLRFPTADELPEDLPVMTMKEIHGENVTQAMQTVMHLLFAHRAMRKPEMRQHFPVFNNVDWEAAELKYAELAPALRRLAPGGDED